MIKADLIFLPSSVLIGIFCKFGFDEDNLPVVAPEERNEVCTLPVFVLIWFWRDSVYVDLNFESCRHSKTYSAKLWPFEANDSNTSTSVE